MKKVVFVIVLLLSFVSAYTFKDGVLFYSNGNYSKAFKIFEKLAEGGNSDAQYNLALMYYKGIGVKKNKMLAFIWFSYAAKSGHKLAQNWVGHLYETGEVLGTKDKLKAFKNFLKSAKKNLDLAQFNIALIYSEKHKQESFKRAAFWYKKAANQGFTKAMNNLAHLYFNGLGVKKDLKKAFYWYKKAATLNDSVAQYNLSMMYLNGEFVKQNDKLALYWLKKSAFNNYSLAQIKLGDFYRTGEHLVDKDYKKAFFWYAKATNLKDPKGYYYVGICYFYGYGVKKDRQKAAYWMYKSKINGYKYADSFMKRNRLYY